MANKVLIMQEEEEIIDGTDGASVDGKDEFVAMSLSSNCKIEGNIVMIPLDEVLSVAANMIIQADMLK